MEEEAKGTPAQENDTQQETAAGNTGEGQPEGLESIPRGVGWGRFSPLFYPNFLFPAFTSSPPNRFLK